MSDPIQLTPDALESLLVDLDEGTIAAFVADLYERTGQDVKREGRLLTATGRDGDGERLLVWTDDRTRISRLLGAGVSGPEVDTVDVIVTTRQDAGAAVTIADDLGAERLDTTDLHDRLLYAMGRDACRELCRGHFDREVEPRPASAERVDNATTRPIPGARIGLVGLVVCGLVVAGAAGLPGGPDVITFVTGDDPGTPAPAGSGPVTPVGAGQDETPSQTPTTDVGGPDGPPSEGPPITIITVTLPDPTPTPTTNRSVG